MAFTGYRAYRGSGGIGSVDFDTPVGSVASSNDSISMAGLGHTPGVTYTYVVRPVVDDLETPDYSAVVQAQILSNGEWAGALPVAVSSFTARAIAGGVIRLQWEYRTPRGGATPLAFVIYSANDPVVDTDGAATASETYTADGLYTKDLTLVDGVTYWFAVNAVTAAAAVGPNSFAGPAIADATAPDAPTIFTGTA